MTERRFSGVIPPTITALDADEELDRDGMVRVVEHQVRGGVDALFVLGTNGEGPNLRDRVRRAVCEVAVEAAAGRVPVLAGVLQPSTARIVDDMRLLADSGVAGFVAAPPYYFSPAYGPNEIVDHYRRLADATDRPILVYNIPQYTRVTVKADAVLRLAEDPRIAGVKDSSGDWTDVQRLILERPRPDFVVLQGHQSSCAISLIAGADGLIPGFANVQPRLLADLYAAAKRGDHAEALSLQARVDRFIRIRGRATLHGTKLLAAHLGLCADHVTTPLPRMTESEAERYLASCIEAGFPSPAAATA